MSERERLFKPKTSQQEVLDYLVRMERAHFRATNKAGIYPTSSQIQLVFGIGRERTRQYLNIFEKKLKTSFRNKR